MKRCALLVLLLAVPLAQAGDLRRVRSAIHPPPKFFLPEPSRNSSPWYNVDLSGGASNGLGEAIAGAAAVSVLAVAAVASPLWGPHVLVDQGFDQRGWFPAHPYADDDRSGMVIGNRPQVPTTGHDYFEPTFVKPWALRLSVDGGHDFDDLGRVGGQLFLDTSVHRLGLLANLNVYHEDRDEAVMTDASMTWRFAQSERIVMHAGVGVRTWTFEDDTDAGINLLYRGDWFPARRLHVSGLFEASPIGDAWFLHGQLQAGMTWKHGELFVGYDCLRVKSVTLQGPTIGLRLWF